MITFANCSGSKQPEEGDKLSPNNPDAPNVY